MIFIYTIWTAYLIFVVLVTLIWLATKQVDNDVEFRQKFSVIIPIRNEENNIEKLLMDLNKQSYPIHKFEVIVVDDHSSDNSLQIITQLQPSLKYTLHVVNLIHDINGKKEAITHGIRKSNFETIVTTDGDCRVGESWLLKINNCYNDHVVMVFGAVQYNQLKNMFHRFQALEFSTLIATGAAMHYIGLPGMCNGANFSFKRNVFNEVNGYSGNKNIPSGDDEFLLRKVRKKYPNGIRFMKDTQAIVFTSPANNWSKFINQKIRWASKWSQHKDIATKIMGLLVLCSNMLFVMMLLFLLLGIVKINYLVEFIIVKFMVEFALAMTVIRVEKKFNYTILAVLLSIIYPFYSIVIGILSVKGDYVWKGRRY